MRHESTSSWANVFAVLCNLHPGRANGARHLPRLLASLGLLLTAATAQRTGAVVEPIRYDRDIRPILADRCFACHGPDVAARKADLRLDSFVAATTARDGSAPVVPGNVEASEVWQRLTTDDVDDVMPPRDSGRKAVTADERELIRRWIEAGAEYEDHWSFVPPTRPAVPAADAARTPVDAFVQQRLARHGVAPAELAEPSQQVRRLYLALTGLPPTPEETREFIADPSDARYQALVDRLLTEEPYRSRHAEHMAQSWLDAARYADTSGIHMDAGRQIWPWRDWVLRSFRDNKPFDEFVVEQLAGDLLPDPTLDQKVATGFHRNHVTTDEGGAINEEYLVEYAVDRTATTGAVFLGLTLGCARCHEHKYDPISQEEFYGLYAFFNSNEEPGLYRQYPDPNKALEPFLEVPTAEQAAARDRLNQSLAEARVKLEQPLPEEEQQQREFFAEARAKAAVRWADVETTRASSRDGATVQVLEDGSVKVTGDNPDRDAHTIALTTEASDLRLLAVRALPDPDHHHGRVGRAENGNAVLSHVSARVRSLADPTQESDVRFVWAWASLEQADGDFRATNLLQPNALGWAVDAHNHDAQPRTALLLAEEPFGYEGGSEIEVVLHYDTGHARHVFGHVSIEVGAIGAAGLDMLPTARSGFFRAGPFTAADSDGLWETVFGPESKHDFEHGSRWPKAPGQQEQRAWVYEAAFAEDELLRLGNGTNVHYVARRLFVPSDRTRTLSLGSDDGFRLFLDGEEIKSNRVDRGVAKDQDQAVVELTAGEHLLVMKIVNTGGVAGLYMRTLQVEGQLDGVLAAGLLDEAAQADLAAELRTAWRLRYSPGYRTQTESIATLETELQTLQKAIPQTMVMKELATPRPAYLLHRGEYDKPDTSRVIPRSIPAALGKMPAGAPDNRLGLARWLTADDNPLVARVAMNRLWMQLFGTGIVLTVEDFGMQGEWPSHPELLDWLACEFRDSGWDVQHMLRLIVTSTTFRQSNRRRPAAEQADPDNRLLGWFPRRRLTAEQLRDQALFAAGILVERFGGPSVKPYQPEGLWREVAMVQSNTRTFQRGAGDDLFRRSLYTYYKRACPPPTMLLLDAPTREFCTTSRLSTNTPLQALAMWNDEQFVEAARALAHRLLSAPGDDDSRLRHLFLACTSRTPDEQTMLRCRRTLQHWRERFAQNPEDAASLLGVGTLSVDDSRAPAELAAWCMLANAALNLDASLCTP
jgi:hypothetical protein